MNVYANSETLAEVLAEHVRALGAESARLVRRSAILIESSQRTRAHDSLVPHCAWCGRIRVGGVWAHPEELPSFFAAVVRDRQSNSICPSCFDEVQAESRQVPLPPTIVVVRASGRNTSECLSDTLAATYTVRHRPHDALEVTLSDVSGRTVNSLLSAISGCLAANRLDPVTIELADQTYVLGEAPAARH